MAVSDLVGNPKGRFSYDMALFKIGCFSNRNMVIILKFETLKPNSQLSYCNDLKFWDRLVWANSADPDQTAPLGAV